MVLYDWKELLSMAGRTSIERVTFNQIADALDTRAAVVTYPVSSGQSIHRLPAGLQSIGPKFVMTQHRPRLQVASLEARANAPSRDQRERRGGGACVRLRRRHMTTRDFALEAICQVRGSYGAASALSSNWKTADLIELLSTRVKVVLVVNAQVVNHHHIAGRSHGLLLSLRHVSIRFHQSVELVKRDVHAQAMEGSACSKRCRTDRRRCSSPFWPSRFAFPRHA
jgi:hypothetical protein